MTDEEGIVAEKKSSVNHVPTKDKWEFDESVASVFEDMLERSIPAYTDMRRLTFEIGTQYVRQNTDVVDLGASWGTAVEPFVKRYGAHNRFVLVEVSPPMLEALHERFGAYEKSMPPVVDIRDTDLRKDFPPVRASLILSILTLQFTPIEYRPYILRRAFEHMREGAALILVEKILGSTAGLDNAFVDVYYDLKRRNGYSQDMIDRKRASLEGVLVPVTARMNEEFLRSAGFHEVDCFWRWANFAGWVAVKR